VSPTSIRSPRKLHASIEPATPPFDEVAWRLVSYYRNGGVVIPPRATIARARTWFLAREWLARGLPSDVATQSITVKMVDGGDPTAE